MIMTYSGDQQDTIDTPAGATDAAAATVKTPEQTEADKALVLKTAKKIKADRKFHQPAFEKMRQDMFMARHGRTKDYPEDWYVANLCGRHIKQKTAALYAKNPKAIARRRETLDFQIWDENPKSLQLAMQTIQTATAALAPPVDPATGQPTMDPTGQPVTPQIPPEYEQAIATAQATLADFQQGMKKRTMIQKIGKTLEILFAQALREQKPLDFKTGAKQLVRRALTAGVGYIELGFQREYGPRPAMMEKLADYRARLDHLRVLTERTNPDDEEALQPDDPEIAELQAAIAALQAEPEIIVREGLIIDFPQATKVIPDRLCQQLVGFVGARHNTIEYMYSCDEVREIFGVDLGKAYTGYRQDGKSNEQPDNPATRVEPDESATYTPAGKGTGLVCVWKHYDKAAGLVYYLADGYPQWLREPAAPDVFVEDFWPLYALTFNEVESETELFPPSDVRLMKDQQMDYNRSRQGQREHRKAARPRWSYQTGAIEKEDAEALARAEAFTATGINLPPDRKLSDLLNVIPVPGVDPNLYETGQLFSDIQLVVGSSESQFGLTGKATATGESIAANASASADGSSIDDLDAFLTVVARASGQILMKEMSPEHVMEVAGPGAVWPPMTLEQIADEIFLEVEAGSTGKPNQAVEINNWKEMLPFLIQMPGISPNWLARETVRRLDDNADLTEALSADMPSIMAQNGLAQISTGNPATDPNAQGGKGAQNAPTEGSHTAGTGPAFGDNKGSGPGSPSVA
ncbi:MULTISPECIES: hypothetical protein [unclassified Mesorhizobium]|uniref:hypothetical protein n=1 Tax=unclassified Mesorhizobium TaxID=325217 RepID=UPI000FD7CE43|nr:MULTISPECIES: hypothetical protein [unclassified Mesorhizobium]TGT76152.1 hypothetical protein EN809_000565 [Mesorhizobium sp. M2E.F.Ca.ET.166.01.1.1]TGW02267.1 hypothetical protein EN797_000565 [Mesorhizobium sp. M2E.F.Ca.ET.154.01.1.1]